MRGKSCFFEKESEVKEVIDKDELVLITSFM